MKGLVYLELCFTLSLVLVFGSILLSPSVINVALANDMSEAPMTKDTITAGSDVDDKDKGDNDQEDALVTQDTITAGGGSEDNKDRLGPTLDRYTINIVLRHQHDQDLSIVHNGYTHLSLM